MTKRMYNRKRRKQLSTSWISLSETPLYNMVPIGLRECPKGFEKCESLVWFMTNVPAWVKDFFVNPLKGRDTVNSFVFLNKLQINFKLCNIFKPKYWMCGVNERANVVQRVCGKSSIRKTQTKIFPKSSKINLKSNCISHLPIDLDPNGRVRLDPNQSENGKYNLISDWFNKTSEKFLCVREISWPGIFLGCVLMRARKLRSLTH